MKITKKEINETIKKVMSSRDDEKIFFKEICVEKLNSDDLEIVAVLKTVNELGIVNDINIFNYKNSDGLLHTVKYFMNVDLDNGLTIF